MRWPKQKKFNWKEFRSPTVLLNAIMTSLTLITSLISYSTLSEMQMSRESANMPVLMLDIENIEYILEGLPIDSYTYMQIGAPNSLSILHDKEVFLGDSRPAIDFIVGNYLQVPDCTGVMTIKNIGLGLAKNISITWSESSLQNLVEFVNSREEYPFNLFNIDVESYRPLSSERPLLIASNESTPSNVMFIECLNESSIQYLSAENKEESSAQVIASGHLLTMILAKVISDFSASSLNTDIPSLKLKIQYEDAFEKKYAADIEIYIQHSGDYPTRDYSKEQKGAHYFEFTTFVNYEEG